MDDDDPFSTIFDIDMDALARDNGTADNPLGAALDPEAYQLLRQSFGDEGNKNNLLTSRGYSINEILAWSK